jgi:hypothetical protein
MLKSVNITYFDTTFVLSLITYHVNRVKKERPNNTKTMSLDQRHTNANLFYERPCYFLIFEYTTICIGCYDHLFVLFVLFVFPYLPCLRIAYTWRFLLLESQVYFSSLSRKRSGIIINAINLPVKRPLLLFDFNQPSISLTDCSKNYQIHNFEKIRLAETQSFHTDRHTARTELTVDLHNLRC